MTFSEKLICDHFFDGANPNENWFYHSTITLQAELLKDLLEFAMKKQREASCKASKNVDAAWYNEASNEQYHFAVCEAVLAAEVKA